MADQTTSEAVIEAMVERGARRLADHLTEVDDTPDTRAHRKDEVQLVLLAARVSVAIDALQEIAEKGKRYGHLHPCWALAMKAEIALAQLTGEDGWSL